MATRGKKSATHLMNNKRRMWQKATLQRREMVAENVMSLTFSPEHPIPFEAGQHYDIRLTAPNGYQAERAYSAGNPPEEKDIIELGVQILPLGEVSPYLFKLQLGGEIELRGPIGGHFVWNVSMPGPLYLVGGGSGMVPLMSMLRHHLKHVSQDMKREIIFLISARDEGRVLYKEELEAISKEHSHIKIIYTLTEKQPEWFDGYSRRVDEEMMREVFKAGVSKMPMIYVCGPTSFVEVVAGHLVRIGFNPHEIRTERFGGA